MPEMSSKRSSSRVRGTWHKYPQRALNRPLRQCRVLGTRPDARDVWSRVEIASGAGGAINEVRKRRVSALPGAFWGKGWGTLTSRRSENRNPPRRAVSFFLSFSHPLLSAPFVSLSLSLPLPRVLSPISIFLSYSFLHEFPYAFLRSNLSDHLLILLLLTPTFACVHVRQARCALFVLSSDLSQCPSSPPLSASPFSDRSSLFLLRDNSILSFVPTSFVSTFIRHSSSLWFFSFILFLLFRSLSIYPAMLFFLYRS